MPTYFLGGYFFNPKFFRMTNTEKMARAKKYTIAEIIKKRKSTRPLLDDKEEILNVLNMSLTTFWRKERATNNTPELGFTLCQLVQIAHILEVDYLELLTTEAKIYYKIPKA